MSRHAGSAPDPQDDAFDATDLAAALNGEAEEQTDEERAAVTAAVDEAQAFVDAELTRGLEDDEDEGGEGDDVLSDEELAAALEGGAEAVHPDEGDEEGIDEADAGAATDGGREAAPGTNPAEATPGDGAPPADDAQAPAAAWEPLVIGADKEQVAIEEAAVQKVAGHYMIAVPEAQFARFQQRLGRGVVAEKVWRHVEAERRELATQRETMEREAGLKTEAEIEAEETLKLLPREVLKSILDERDLDLLDARVAARVAKEGVRKAPEKPAEGAPAAAPAKETVTAEAAPEPAAEAPQLPDEDIQAFGLADEIKAIVGQFPDPAVRAQLRALGIDTLKEVYTELYEVRDQVVWKQDGEWYTNRDLIFEKLKARIPATATAPASSTPAADTGSAPAAAATATGTTADASTPAPRQPAATANRAETFNRGVNSAARPTTTSVKARRAAAAARPAMAGATRDAADRHRARSEAEIQAEADEEWESTKRGLLRSSSLDIDED